MDYSCFIETVGLFYRFVDYTQLEHTRYVKVIAAMVTGLVTAFYNFKAAVCVNNSLSYCNGHVGLKMSICMLFPF